MQIKGKACLGGCCESFRVPLRQAGLSPPGFREAHKIEKTWAAVPFRVRWGTRKWLVFWVEKLMECASTVRAAPTHLGSRFVCQAMEDPS